MNIKGIFKKSPVSVYPDGEEKGQKPEVPDGLLVKCAKCRKGILAEELPGHMYICPKCGANLRMSARERINLLCDEASFEEWDTGLEGPNPLRMKGYPDRLKALRESTGLDEAVTTGSACIGGRKTVLMVMDCRFLTASMGQVVGEKITRAFERATEERLPVIIFCCSGGARMQEGMISLMQMAKTSAALKRHSDAGLLYAAVLTDPTTGGVTASFAMLGDIILAEPGALIGFAGPKVIEQTIGQKLPKGFQRSEFLLEHGFIDAIVKREEMRDTLEQILRLHDMENSQEAKENAEISAEEGNDAVRQLGQRSKEKTAWQRVLLARARNRPAGADYIERLFTDFFELHGDRRMGDDPAVCGGIGLFQGKPVTVIVQMKGKDTKENIRRNFGMPLPEGYRKALRLMKQAEKFHRPVLCFVDTPGAFCGIEAEERGEGAAIAETICEMSALETPVLSVLIGEGGSGGALALAVADEVWSLENAVYSILSPEGFATILWKDAKLAERAAKVMRLTSYDLKKMGIVEKIFLEPEEYTRETMSGVCKELEEKICQFLEEKTALSTETLIRRRYDRFRKM